MRRVARSLGSKDSWNPVIAACQGIAWPENFQCDGIAFRRRNRHGLTYPGHQSAFQGGRGCSDTLVLPRARGFQPV